MKRQRSAEPPASWDSYRALTTAAVLVVAAIAAVISYEHVAALAIRYGQPRMAAYLLPVSVDGLVTVSSLVMLRAARIGVSAPWLARTGLGLAVAATLACNVGYGVAHGWPGALLSGWPAVAFVVAAETAISMTRRGPAGEDAEPDAGPDEVVVDPADAVPVAGLRPALHAVPSAGTESLSPRSRTSRQSRQSRRKRKGSGKRIPAEVREAAVLAALDAEADLSHAELARRFECDEATIRRIRKKLVPVIPND